MLGHGVEHHGAYPGDHQEHDHDAVDDHQPHGGGPRHLRGDGHRHQGVDTEARRDREGIVRDDPHENGHHARDESRHGGDLIDRQDRPGRVLGGAGVVGRVTAEDERVQDDDVAHRHERDQTTADLTADCGPSLADPEEPVEPRPLLLRGHI